MKNISAYILIFALLTVSSCLQPEAALEVDENVNISAVIGRGLQSRVSDDGKSFSDGDIITVKNTSRTTSNIAAFTYSESFDSWHTLDELFWKGSDDNDFQAWHPAAASFEGFVIPSDQTGGLSDADWMTATAMAKKADGEVQFSFRHHLAKVIINVVEWSHDFTQAEKSIETLMLLSLNTQMAYDGTSTTGDGEQEYVNAFVSSSNAKFAAILSPGEYAEGAEILRLTLANGQVMKVVLASSLVLEASSSYSFSLTVGKDLIKMEPDGVSVSDWDSEELENGGLEEVTYVNLSDGGTANSYIVSEAGSYKFTPTKGNSNESVGSIASAEVLWETFGTDVTPNVGDLVKNVKYEDGVISFETPFEYKEGNALIAAKDASDNILWSWHIWLTDQPKEQVYYNDAGTMMDRNLGATSATPGDVGALGLLYQWGRKDPFLASSSISQSVLASSTLESWPSAVLSDALYGTIEYAVANPMTLIVMNGYNSDWYYTGDETTDNTRWNSVKTIYDPCPVGWRVPDGGGNGVWAYALGQVEYFPVYQYDFTNKGMHYSELLGPDQTIWYPASGFLYGSVLSIHLAGEAGYFWSCSPSSQFANCFGLSSEGYFNQCDIYYRGYGQSVRCMKEPL